jgi:hypothetical protein
MRGLPTSSRSPFRKSSSSSARNELEGTDEAPNDPAAVNYPEEIDLRAEDDALIAEELEAAALAEAEEAAKAEAEPDDEEDEGAESTPSRPRRGRRGGRGRRSPGRSGGPLEGTFDHGEEGYGLWLDPAVVDNPTYAEHWAGHRSVEVTVEEEQIVIRRSGESS